MARPNRRSQPSSAPPPAEPKPRQPRKLLRHVAAAVDDVHGAGDPLATLRAVCRLRQAVDELERSTVKDARHAGVTWTQIGDVYNLSKQGAQQRFRQS